MKKMKKILSVILTLAMVLGMSVTTFAVEPETDPAPNPPAGGSNGTSTTTVSAKGDRTDKGTITVNGFYDWWVVDEKGQPVTDSDGKIQSQLTITAYQIVEARYESHQSYNGNIGNNDGVFSGYKAIYNDNITDETKKIDVKNFTDTSVSEAQLTAIVDYITAPGNSAISGTSHVMTLDRSSATTASATVDNLPVGSYLIMVTGAESRVYNPVVASIYYTTDDDGNAIDGGNVTLSLATTTPWVKVSETPEVEKNVVTKKEENGNITEIQASDHGTANIGDELTYQVIINPIPSYGGTHPVLNIEDTLSAGLDFVPNSVEVKIYGKDENPNTVADINKGKVFASSNYIVTPPDASNGKKLTVDFVLKNPTSGNGYTLDTHAGKKVVITYRAKLNDNAAINEKENFNTVKLNYTRDSKLNSDDVTDNKTDKTYTYTFDIDGGVTGQDKTTITEGILTKTGEDKSSSHLNEKALAGATFTLYTKNPDTLGANESSEDYIYKNGDKKTNANAEKGFGGTVTSNSDGQLPIRGLEAGTYYLKETAAPSPYTLNAHVFKIVITPEYYTEDDKSKNNIPDGYEVNQLKSWTITIDGQTTNTFKVVNTSTVHVNEKDGQNGTITPVEIKNTKIASLPSTGGIGTTIFTFGGCAIMILAAALFFISRRKSAK